MLLAKESNPVENLPRARTRCFEAFPELGVLELQPLDPFRSDLATAGCPVDCLHPRFGLKCAAAEAGQLVTEMVDEPLKLLKRLGVRTIAVGFQVCSLVR